uniref:Uncharacterized protein n=1 Tax=Romanomermis culicivorax TaxID=13658 RepID=A0A915I211_ROMCU
MQCTQHEEFNGWVDTGKMAGCCQRNAMPQVGGSEVHVIWQSGCLTRQTRFKTWRGTGRRSNSENRFSHDN